MIRKEAGDDERAALGLDDALGLARQQLLHVAAGEGAGELLPQRGVRGLGQLEDAAAGDAFGDETELVRPREFRGVLAFHKSREGLAEQARTLRARDLRADELAQVVVEAVREGERRASRAAQRAATGANVREKLRDALRWRRLGERGGRIHAAVIVRAGDEHFYPRLRVRRAEAVAIRQLLDLRRRERREDVPRDFAQ